MSANRASYKEVFSCYDMELRFEQFHMEGAV